MTVVSSQTHPSGPSPADQSTPESGFTRDELHQRLAHLHRIQLKPVGPLENTLVETIIHNSLQLHAAQSAERDISLHSSHGLMNLNRLARYRAALQRSTRDALHQLRELQRLRLTPEPRAMAAAASPSLFRVPSPQSAAAANNEPAARIPFPAEPDSQPRASSSEPEPPDSPAPASPMPPRPAPCDIAPASGLSPGPTAAQPKPPQPNR